MAEFPTELSWEAGKLSKGVSFYSVNIFLNKENVFLHSLGLPDESGLAERGWVTEASCVSPLMQRTSWRTSVPVSNWADTRTEMMCQLPTGSKWTKSETEHELIRSLEGAGGAWMVQSVRHLPWARS